MKIWVSIFSKLFVVEGETLEIKNINVGEQHTDSVNGIVLGHNGDSIFSVGSDTHLRIWR